jgi:phosphatidylserine synthase
MIRLSSFHILTTDQHFVGLPASASTLLLLILALLSIDLWVLFLILFLLALALISPLKFPKPGRYINSAAAVLFLLSVFLISFNTDLVLFLLLLAVLLYVTAGPLLNFLKKEKKKNN